MPITANKPTTLRNGSIYRVLGKFVGRLEGVVKSSAVMSHHGETFLANVYDIRLADKEDVKAYLRRARK